MAVRTLTPLNFIHVVKQMSVQDRNLLKIDDIINLILEAPEQNDMENLVSKKINEFAGALETVRQQSISNAAEIVTLKKANDNLKEELDSSKDTVDSLSSQLAEVKINITIHENHLNEIEQYLRANNVEVVGLPNTAADQFEETLLKTFNSLPEIRDSGYTITAEDIDISHPVKTERKDGKNVAVCRFVSRKT